MRNPLSPSYGRTLGIFLGFLLFIQTPLFGGNQSPSRSYFLPMVEVEKVLSQWLSNSGFAILPTSRDFNQVQVKAIKGHERWEIRLKPHSPLACSIQAEYTHQDQKDLAKVEKLWAFLTDYSQGLSPVQESLAGKGQALSFAQDESIVCIQADGKNQAIHFSGFIIDPKGFILSTAHDLGGLKEVTVILHDGLKIKGRLLKLDLFRDLSLIEVRRKFISFIAIDGRRNLPVVGEKVYAAGCPRQPRAKMQTGNIEGLLRQSDKLPLWQVSMETLPGSSGSPVFDSQGNLLGVVKGRYRGTDSIGFLIPLETVTEFLKE
jgi:serine protease Do